MGRTVRQKRKNRSSRPKVKQANKPKKQLNPLGNSIIAKNWDKKETLTQNYRRLGLLTRLQAPTGGTEPAIGPGAGDRDRKPSSSTAPLGMGVNSAAPGSVREVRVERDAAGRIVRVIGAEGRSNLLNDPLNELESDDEDGLDGRARRGWWGVAPDGGGGDVEEEEEEEDGARSGNKVLRELERLARQPEVKTPRHVSDREAGWIGRLVARHGDDIAAMARDVKLNPMQQSVGDISKRVKRWMAEKGR